MSGNNDTHRNSARGASGYTNPRGGGNTNRSRGLPAYGNAPSNVASNVPRTPPASNVNAGNPHGRHRSVSGFGVSIGSGSQAPQSPPRAAPSIPTVSFGPRDQPTIFSNGHMDN